MICTNAVLYQEDSLLVILPQCVELLKNSSILFEEFTPNAALLRPLEVLRRLCGKVLDEGITCSRDLHKVFVGFLETFVIRVEEAVEKVGFSIQFLKSFYRHCLRQWSATLDLAACAVDSLCSLSKAKFSPLQFEAQMASFEYLLRATSLATRKWSVDTTDSASLTLIKVLRRLGTTFWSNAVTLYQKNSYGMAIRFLLQACELSTTACKNAKGITIPHDYNESIQTLAAHIPQRWEVLGDCYIKIGECEVCVFNQVVYCARYSGRNRPHLRRLSTQSNHTLWSPFPKTQFLSTLID